ncbi:MAG: hypothetical protein L3K09_06260 [Thermoplasmata archaeon]|nr:hypothetical protein [Thermoplasmata archaeon]
MTEESNRTPNLATRSAKKPVRWLSIVVTLGIVLVSGSVLADVVLAYTANNGVGTNAADPFVFQQGANYATANSLGIITSAFTGGGSSGAQVTTTVSGVASVGVTALDSVEFATAIKLPAAAVIGNVYVITPTAFAPANVVCAYAFISTASPSAGNVAVAGAPAGCQATTPALGALSAGCAAGSAAVATVNLLTGAVIGTIAGACTVASATVAATVTLYISFGITVNGVVVATSLNTFTVPVTMP